METLSTVPLKNIIIRQTCVCEDIDKKANCLQKTLQEDLIKDFVIVDESVTGLFVKKERLK